MAKFESYPRSHQRRRDASRRLRLPSISELREAYAKRVEDKNNEFLSPETMKRRQENILNNFTGLSDYFTGLSLDKSRLVSSTDSEDIEAWKKHELYPRFFRVEANRETGVFMSVEEVDIKKDEQLRLHDPEAPYIDLYVGVKTKARKRDEAVVLGYSMDIVGPPQPSNSLHADLNQCAKSGWMEGEAAYVARQTINVVGAELSVPERS